MKQHKKAFNKTPYIHMAGSFNDESGKYEYARPYVLIWQGMTPKGKQSKFFHAESYKAEPVGKNVYPLPALRKGYTWSGPYIYAWPSASTSRAVSP